MALDREIDTPNAARVAVAPLRSVFARNETSRRTQYDDNERRRRDAASRADRSDVDGGSAIREREDDARGGAPGIVATDQLPLRAPTATLRGGDESARGHIAVVVLGPVRVQRQDVVVGRDAPNKKIFQFREHRERGRDRP